MFTKRLLFLATLLTTLPLILQGGMNQEVFLLQRSRKFHTSPDISFLDVNAFVQDSLGYMWIATLGGLNRYNGYEFQHFLHDASDSLSLQNDFVFSLFIDSSQNFWVGTANGVCRFDFATNQFERYQGQITPIYSFFEDHNGRIWGASPMGPGLIDASEHTVSFPFKEQFVNIFWEDDAHRLWMGLSEQQGLAVQNNEGAWEYYTLPGKRGVVSVYSDPQGLWWLGTNAGIIFFDPHTRTFKNPLNTLSENQKLSNTQINFIKEVEPLKLLIGTTTEGLFYFDIVTQTLLHNEPARFNPFHSAQLHACYIDRQDNVWIGSYDKGFVIGNKKSDIFNADHNLGNKFKDKFVTRIIEDKEQNIWIGTRYDGLYRYTPSGDFSFWGNLLLHPNKNEFLETLFIDSHEQIWVAFETQLIRLNISKGGDIQVGKRFNIDNVRVLKEDHEGNIWVGTWSGLYQINPAHSEMKIDTVFTSGITDIYPLESGDLLFSVYGVGIYQIKKGSTTPQLIHFPAHTNNITGTCITLFQDTRQRLWVGSYGNGLLCWQGDQCEILSQKDGLPSNNVLCFQEDLEGNIWLSTSHGISRLNLSKNEPIITSYFKSDGIGGDQYHEKAGCRTSDGRIFFGGNHGLTFFIPSAIMPNNTPPLINIEDLKVFNQSVQPAPSGSILNKDIAHTGHITLNHKQTTISLDYAGIDFFTSNKLRYKYILEGFDKQWNYVGDFRQATYTNLPPGKYTFYVSAINGDGMESIRPAALQITVKSAPWLTWQAWLIYAAILGVLVIFSLRMFLHSRMKRQLIEIEQKEREREREISKMKITFFTNISHELRTPLTLIAAPLEKLFSGKEWGQKETKSLNIVHRNVQRMLQLTNQLMDFIKMEHGVLKLKLRYVDIIRHLHHIYESFSYFAEKKEIKLIFDPHTPSLSLWADTNKIEKILYNLLSNAIKYTPEKGTVEIISRLLSREACNAKYDGSTCLEGDSFIEIAVSDTGPGIPSDKLDELFVRYRQIDGSSGLMPDYSGSGIGLHYTKSLVEIHKGKIRAEIKPEGGMEFSFILPFDDRYSDDEKRDEDPIPCTHEEPGEWHSKAMCQSEETSRKQEPVYSILIAEDHIELMDFLTDLFADTYRVFQARDGNRAWELIQSESPDLLLSDIVMPGMSGYELCAMIKNDREYCHIPVVLLTAKRSMPDQIEGLASGADSYICKPFNVEFLQLTIKNLLQNKEVLRRYFSTPKAETGSLMPVTLNLHDKEFMDDLIQLLEKELSNPDLNIDYIAQEMGFSRSAFYRKIKGIANVAPNDFLRDYRLKRAAEMIATGLSSLTEVADQTGFRSYSYFSKAFKEHFKVSPKEYM